MWLYIPKTTSVSTPVEADSISDSDSRIQLLARSFTWNESFKQPRSWSTTLKRASWSRRLFGLIPEPSTADRLSIEWIGSLEDSPASRGVSPALEQGLQTNAGSGLTLNDWFARYDPEESLWKTSQASFMEELNTFSAGWPRSGTMRNGFLYERPTLVRPTVGSGSSSWPTIRTNDSQSGRPNDGKDRIGPDGTRYGINLADKVESWPTPNAAVTAQDITKSGDDRTQPNKLGWAADEWKTPTTDSASQRTGRYAQGGLPLSKQAADREWMTPKAHEPGYNAGTTGRPLEMATHLNTQASHWATPKRSMLGAGNPKRKDQHRLVDEVASFHQDQETPMPGQQSSTDDQTSRRRLNYRFVEALMGLPSNWTDFHALLD